MPMNHSNTKEEVIESFRVFDTTDKGYISTDELRQILNELGEYMDPNEIEELVGEADPNGSGSVDYHAFVDKLFLWE